MPMSLELSDNNNAIAVFIIAFSWFQAHTFHILPRVGTDAFDLGISQGTDDLCGTAHDEGVRWDHFILSHQGACADDGIFTDDRAV